MRVSRDLDAMRFVAECSDRDGFVPEDIQCLLCGRRMNPEVHGTEVSLTCSGCGNRAKRFDSEPELNSYIAHNWNQLRQEGGAEPVDA